MLFIQAFPVPCGPGFSGTGYLLTVVCVVLQAFPVPCGPGFSGTGRGGRDGYLSLGNQNSSREIENCRQETSGSRLKDRKHPPRYWPHSCPRVMISGVKQAMSLYMLIYVGDTLSIVID